MRSPDPLQFFTHPQSRGRIVRWMLEEIAEHDPSFAYETQVIEYGAAMQSPAYRQINPMGKVPAIRHGTAVITECAAICAYLADAFPSAQLAPPLTSRAAYYRWLFFASGPYEQASANQMLGFTVPPERRRMVGYGSHEAVIDTLETAVQGRPYLAGDRFSAADVYVGSQIGWGLDFGSLERRPAFEAYVTALRQRPAYRRALAIDEAVPPAG